VENRLADRRVIILAFAQPGLGREVNNGLYYVQPLDEGNELRTESQVVQERF
jgi:hypothetical protein